MATILFCPVTFNLAETTRMIRVAQALAALDAGHRLLFMGYEEDYVPLIHAAGFEYVPCNPVLSARDREQLLAFDQGKTFRSPLTVEFVGARVTLERQLIRDHDAAAIVTGSNLTSYISARAEEVPLYYPVPFALTRPQVEQARHLFLVGGRGQISRVADLMLTAAFRWIYTRAHLAPRAMVKVAQANGVRSGRTIASLITADVNLVTDMPWDLEGFDLPPEFTQVGPIFAHIDAPLPDVVAELAAAPEPLVYLGLGSSADRKLALTAARALGSLPVNVIAPIRHYLRPDDAVPPNVHITDLLPAHRLGGLVDAAVLHGGQGTVQTACATGIPFVGMGLQPEQTWHVRTAERRGHAIAVSPGRVGSPEFLEAVKRVLSDPRIRAVANEVGDAYANVDGAAASARIIDAAL